MNCPTLLLFVVYSVVTRIIHIGAFDIAGHHQVIFDAGGVAYVKPHLHSTVRHGIMLVFQTREGGESRFTHTVSTGGAGADVILILPFRTIRKSTCRILFKPSGCGGGRCCSCGDGAAAAGTAAATVAAVICPMGVNRGIRRKYIACCNLRTTAGRCILSAAMIK